MNKKTEVIRFVKYASVGVSNTVITFLTFVILRAFNVDENLSNAMGYILGMINSFYWNRSWVFKAKEGNGTHQAILFLVGAGLCWLVQLVLFRILLAQDINETIAYLIGMVFYTLLNYLFNKTVAFKKSK